MFIENCQIRNYKGFRESGQISFSPGFNVVVGQNNAGKTALTEALSLQFQNKPHRSLVKKSEGNSSAELLISVGSSEAYSLMSQSPAFLVSGMPNEAPHATVDRINRYIQKGTKSICHFENGQCRATLAGLQGGSHNIWACVSQEKDRIVQASSGYNPSTIDNLLSNSIFQLLKQDLYVFRAERLNIHESAIGTNHILASNAGNLAEVLHLLQSTNRHRFQRFVNDVRTVFSDIQDIAITPVSANITKINVWFVDPITERQDLAIPLSDCGTGITQSFPSRSISVARRTVHPSVSTSFARAVFRRVC